jgi:hypothetical protein
MKNTLLGGGSWVCEKCHITIHGTSIYHDCCLLPVTDKKEYKTHKLYTLPANTKVWSIDLQESISIDKDIPVCIENTTTFGDYIFVVKLIKFENMALSMTMGTDGSSYKKTKIEFGTSLKNLIFVKNIDIYE